jgi:hypothetical protein
MTGVTGSTRVCGSLRSVASAARSTRRGGVHWLFLAFAVLAHITSGCAREDEKEVVGQASGNIAEGAVDAEGASTGPPRASHDLVRSFDKALRNARPPERGARHRAHGGRALSEFSRVA